MRQVRRRQTAFSNVLFIELTHKHSRLYSNVVSYQNVSKRQDINKTNWGIDNYWVSGNNENKRFLQQYFLDWDNYLWDANLKQYLYGVNKNLRVIKHWTKIEKYTLTLPKHYPNIAQIISKHMIKHCPNIAPKITYRSCATDIFDFYQFYKGG